MFILATTVVVVFVVVTDALGFEQFVITKVITDDIFSSGFNSMQFSDWSSIIHLECMFGSIGLAIRMRVIQQEFLNDIHFKRIFDIFIVRIIVRVLRLCTDLVRESDHTVLVLFRGTLIIDITTHRIPGTVSVAQRAVLISQSVSLGIPHCSQPVALIIIGTAVHTE